MSDKCPNCGWIGGEGGQYCDQEPMANAPCWSDFVIAADVAKTTEDRLRRERGEALRVIRTAVTLLEHADILTAASDFCAAQETAREARRILKKGGGVDHE